MRSGAENAGHLLQGLPVEEAVILGGQQLGGGIALLVEVLGETPFGPGEGNEVERGAVRALGPVFLHGRVALQRETLGGRAPAPRVVGEERECPRLDGQLGLPGAHVVGGPGYSLASMTAL